MTLSQFKELCSKYCLEPNMGTHELIYASKVFVANFDIDYIQSTWSNDFVKIYFKSNGNGQRLVVYNPIAAENKIKKEIPLYKQKIIEQRKSSFEKDFK
jgi:hypothetical protein